MKMANEKLVADSIISAEEVSIPACELIEDNKPRLLIRGADPDRTVSALRDILAAARILYDRGVPVRLANDQIQGGAVAQVMTPDILVMTVHSICRPYILKEKHDGTIVEVNVRLPRFIAVMYLEWRGEWKLPVLNGIASAPMLANDGTINSAEGYDCETGMWRENVPNLSGLIPDEPTDADAAKSFHLIRETFKTFCFADAETVLDPASGTEVVDTSRPPGRDESSFMVALQTAVCRPSLDLAPGVLLRAAPMSGAGAGKGLIARCTALIAFGREPHAVTGGGTSEEQEKRIAAELIEGSPVLFLDNLNYRAFKSDLLASAITERPARVRILGKSQMVPLNASALVILTGNGLSVSEDLARRFITVDFDPRTENPEARTFASDIKAEVTKRRPELLAAALTIWRWGRLSPDLKSGQMLGSFERWCGWVRDPLLALGCLDPAERVAEAKEQDTRRQMIAELFGIWSEHHGDNPVAVSDLHDDVGLVIDPQNRGRQYRTAQLGKLAGTRMSGHMLTRQAAAGKWGAATYALVNADKTLHRGHRGHRTADDPMPPMLPMPPGIADDSLTEGEPPKHWSARV